MTRTIREIWFSPLYSKLLESRRESLILAGAGAVHLGLNLMGLPGWVCPIRAATGIPCPGCGLTTASMELLKGDVLGSLHTHAFAPVFVLALLIMLILLVLPDRTRQNLISGIARMEALTGITSWVLLGLFVYWGARLPGLL